ncbi:MAG: CBS domain-containing protein [Patescibacteria group bacterium]|jgi:CBS domain-containing protein
MKQKKQYLIKDYMSDHGGVIIQESADFHQAVNLMIKKKTNGLVVVDEKNKVTGILSSWDLIRQVVPNYLEGEENLSSFEDADIFSQRINEVKNLPIKKFMTKNVHAVHPEGTLMEASTLLAKHGIRQLPVTDQNGTLVGYLNRTDIKRAIGDILNLN